MSAVFPHTAPFPVFSLGAAVAPIPAAIQRVRLKVPRAGARLGSCMAVLLLLEHIVAADGAILNRNDVAAKTAKPLTVGGNVAANGNFGYAKPGRCVPQPQDTRFLNQPSQRVQPGIVCTYSAHLISAFGLSLRFIFRC